MGWKEWPYWLKGGLIAMSAGIIQEAIPYRYAPEVLYAIIHFLPFFILIMLINGLKLNANLLDTSFARYFISFATIFLFFLVGMIIGEIYNDIKSRKQNGA